MVYNTKQQLSNDKKYDIFIETYRNKLEVRSFPSLSHFTQPVSSICLSNSLLFVGTSSIRVFNLDKQILIKQFNMINKSNDIETTLLLVKMDWDKNDHGEYAHVDISEYIFKPTSTSSDKEETQVEKMTTIVC
ncbi:unnamed protein product [Rotaria sp. Silwood2]|nr:unnamed protein product [Rotaria sp. Silwood2]CAF4315897.1 unnamed protein product [Rotaria sp. Silwood2]CAF4327012.1 unnamed protein product [Rotaria sp. Silwood2]